MGESTPILPPELCDYILDQLRDDKQALRSCALTSRGWAPRAQHHLFESVYLDWSNCYAFSSLLASNPLLADHVGTLEIEGAFGIFSMDRLHGATLDAWLRAVPAWIPARLTHLTKLELALLTIDADLARSFFTGLRGVTHLTLWACALTTFDVFAEVFLSYASLKRLTIAFTQEWETNPCAVAPPPVLGTARPQVEVVELTSSCDNFKVLTWLVAQDLHHSVHTLSCTRVSPAALRTLAAVLGAFAPALQNFRIGLGDSMSASDFPHGADWTFPSFAPLPALTTLTLDIHTARLSAVPYTLGLLGELAASALRTLAFAVKCGGFDNAHEIPWLEIAQAVARFASGARSKLAEVRVGVRERGSGGGELAPVVYVDTRAGTVGAGGRVDLLDMERRVRAAFAAQGMEKLVVFEQLR